jgi:hypothetical protein
MPENKTKKEKGQESSSSGSGQKSGARKGGG